ncbi:MAG: cation diffusion facilitator family transporter, partial [Planctomycetota bacterium]
PPTPRNTYGYYRAEILAALVNGSALVAIAVYILVEALQRFRAPPAVFGPGMLAVALGGLAVNLAALRLLHGSHAESLNVRAAWLHVLSDTAGSVGAVLAAALVWGLGWRWPDPLAGVVIAVLIVYSAWLLLKETVAVLMESAPRHLDADAVRDAIARVPGVLGVHDLHIWTITSGLDALSCHVVAAELAEAKALLHAVQRVLREEFRIWHVTVQIETPGFAEP